MSEPSDTAPTAAALAPTPEEIDPQAPAMSEPDTPAPENLSVSCDPGAPAPSEFEWKL